MCAQPKLALEALGCDFVEGGGTEGERRGAVERAHVDVGVALVRDVLSQRVDRTLQIGGERHRHRDLRERLAAADRRVHDGVGGELVVRDDEPPLVGHADERVREADLFYDA